MKKLLYTLAAVVCGSTYPRGKSPYLLPGCNLTGLQVESDVRDTLRKRIQARLELLAAESLSGLEQSDFQHRIDQFSAALDTTLDDAAALIKRRIAREAIDESLWESAGDSLSKRPAGAHSSFERDCEYHQAATDAELKYDQHSNYKDRIYVFQGRCCLPLSHSDLDAESSSEYDSM